VCGLFLVITWITFPKLKRQRIVFYFVSSSFAVNVFLLIQVVLLPTEYFVLEYPYRLNIFVLEYPYRLNIFVLEYPYRLSILYWNILTD
jgi:hypothetical protein